MKKAIVVLLGTLTLFTACGEHEAEKPENLIGEDEMVDILYDITLLQAIKSYKPKNLRDNNVDATTYIYKKYDIDSVTFAESQSYYAADLEVYERIHKKVKAKMEIEKKKYEPEDKKTDKDTIGQAKDIDKNAAVKKDSLDEKDK
ncbi:hypothetical protein GCM10007424_06560 [Flavobacterium suaedae]|uniref:DUF4296 domain-containing protein n=1 Tax=Flavobacterium suaedae TaxID=1767027 RepID=A0ABQ1JIH6_9FLAO|nr:DUF4296 domain-containing protein [Flavobacterium suaedae]GGB69276.1 hypothetical protein GCM10007424_06560 [Flavobacterium suaedae]